MVKTAFYVIFLNILFLNLCAQVKTGEDTQIIKLSGYVKTDVFYDTRQNVTAREGHLLLYPAAPYPDTEGKDINAKSSLNILSVQTRFNAAITGPDALGAKIRGVIEADFFGNADSDINGFRLRHAYLTLNWDKTSLMIGQYWIPMMVLESCPGTVSFNTGSPFQPFGRNPQIRLTHSVDNVKFIIAASSQRDIPSPGPDGTSSVYLRNSSLPIFDAHIQFSFNNVFLGAGADFKMLKPRLKTALNYETDENIKSFAFMGYGKIEAGLFTAKAEGVLGENMADYLLLGGYAVKEINPLTDGREYSNIRAMAGWTDFSYGKEISVGLFAGYCRNLGSPSVINGSSFIRGANINYIYRISPRVLYNTGKIQLAFEVEHTAAAYGNINNKGRVTRAELISNTRLLAAVFYFF